MNQDTGTLEGSRNNQHKLSLSFNKIRSQTRLLAERLSAEDQCVQSMPNASPTKWHLAHTTWFFETFILKNNSKEYHEYNADFNFLFNSYYEQIGERHARDSRGVLTRPSVKEVVNYRDYIDSEMEKYLERDLKEDELAM